MAERGFPYVPENPEKDLQLQILVCGKTGTGKSALVNSVIGRQVCKSAGPRSAVVDGGEAITKSVNAVHSNSNGIFITIWDSPGLQDGCSKDEDYLQDMYDKCKNVDLVYYCVDMTTSRWTYRDENALRLMAEKFDATFWSKCILVLTKANIVRVPPARRKDKRAYFEQLYNNFKRQFQNQLQAHNVPKDVSTEIPATCAGIIDGEDEGPGTPSHNDRYLYYTSNQGDYSDGERKHFLSELWLIGFKRVPIDSRLKYKHATGEQERFAKDVYTIIEEMCESKEDEVKTRVSQNKSEDKIVGAEKKRKKNEVFNAQDQDFPVQRGIAEKNRSSVSQKKIEDETKDLQLQILVCGKTGTGKSALVNSVIGRQVCKSGCPGSAEVDDGEALKSVTKSVNAVQSNCNGIILTIWDSPGLQDGTAMEKVYLQDMYDNCKNVDLVYYCVDMTTSRWTYRDENALRLMAEKFDTTFWSKCILVLTKANSVRVPTDQRKNKKAYFEILYNNFKKRFQNQLQAHNVPKDVSTEIPATCAGIIDGEDEGPGTPSHNDRYLYYTSNQGDYSDGERKHFLSELWLIGFKRVPIDSRLKYKHATDDRKRFAKDVYSTIEEMCESKEDEVKANKTRVSQSKSEDKIVGAEKKRKKNEVFYAQDQDVPLQKEVAEKNKSSISQKRGEDEKEDTKKKQSSKGQNTGEVKMVGAEKKRQKNQVFYAQDQDVPIKREEIEDAEKSKQK